MARHHAHMLPDADGRLAVTCWCEARIVRVPAEQVRAGRTAPCGPHCTPNPRRTP